MSGTPSEQVFLPISVLQRSHTFVRVWVFDLMTVVGAETFLVSKELVCLPGRRGEPSSHPQPCRGHLLCAGHRVGSTKPGEHAGYVADSVSNSLVLDTRISERFLRSHLPVGPVHVSQRGSCSSKAFWHPSGPQKPRGRPHAFVITTRSVQKPACPILLSSLLPRARF